MSRCGGEFLVDVYVEGGISGRDLGSYRAIFDREREREGTFIIALSAEKVRLKLIDKK